MLWGICHGYPSWTRGAFGRSLLGYQTIRALGTPPGGSDSLKTRFTPNAVDGDIYITSVWAENPSTGSIYRFQMRQDGTYWFDAGGDESRQFILADLRSSSGLNGEGTLAINDAPPRPNTASGTLLSGATFQYGSGVNFPLQAIDPQGDVITFSVVGSLFPGGSLTGAAVTGTPTTYGVFGFTLRMTDPYQAFSDSPEQVTIASVMPNFADFINNPILLSSAQATLTALGISSSSTAASSNQPLHTILSQSIPPGNIITTPGTTVIFTDSNAATFTTNPNLFPATLPGITFESRRIWEYSSGYQPTLPGKVTSQAFMQYPLIRWDLHYEFLNQNGTTDELKQLEGLFNAKQAQAGTFLYLDPSFNTVAAEPFGTGNSATKSFQLIAAFGNPGGPSLPEIIQQLQAAPSIFDNGSLVSTANYTINSTGIVTFTTAPVTGHALTWSGSFYYLAQFDMDEFTPSEFLYRLWEMQSVRLKSVIT